MVYLPVGGGVAVLFLLGQEEAGLGQVRHARRVILGVVVFDIFPEIVDLAQSTGRGLGPAMLALVSGFLCST